MSSSPRVAPHAAPTIAPDSNTLTLGSPMASSQQWYAVYTRPRHEKWVGEQCSRREVENFVPLYTARRVWKEHKAEVQLPLFPSYVFVRMALRDKLRVLTIPSVVSLVAVAGVPAVVEDAQIESLQKAVQLRTAQPHRFLTRGTRVRIATGPLAGLEGIVLRRKDSVVVVVSIEWMSRSVAVQLEAVDLERLNA